MLILQNLEELLATYPQFGLWYTAICRWCMPILAIWVYGDLPLVYAHFGHLHFGGGD